MDIAKITVGKRLAYANHKTSGTFQVTKVGPHPSNGVVWVTGFDKTKKRDIKVFPSQVHPVSRA